MFGWLKKLKEKLTPKPETGREMYERLQKNKKSPEQYRQEAINEYGLEKWTEFEQCVKEECNREFDEINKQCERDAEEFHRRMAEREEQLKNDKGRGQ